MAVEFGRAGANQRVESARAIGTPAVSLFVRARMCEEASFPSNIKACR